jgi:hypothetical protein
MEDNENKAMDMNADLSVLTDNIAGIEVTAAFALNVLAVTEVAVGNMVGVEGKEIPSEGEEKAHEYCLFDRLKNSNQTTVACLQEILRQLQRL